MTKSNRKSKTVASKTEKWNRTGCKEFKGHMMKAVIVKPLSNTLEASRVRDELETQRGSFKKKKKSSVSKQQQSHDLFWFCFLFE